MWQYFVIISVVAGFALTCFAEIRLNDSNVRFLRHSGGEEIAQYELSRLYVWSVLTLVLGIAEYSLAGFPVDPSTQSWGALILLAGLILRIWSIHSLGTMWTRQCIYIYGVPMVTTGPYRWCRHPEYLSRIMEALGIMLVLSSFWSGLVCILGINYYLIKIISLEDRQLQLMAFQNLKPVHDDPAREESSAIAN